MPRGPHRSWLRLRLSSWTHPCPSLRVGGGMSGGGTASASATATSTLGPALAMDSGEASAQPASSRCLRAAGAYTRQAAGTSPTRAGTGPESAGTETRTEPGNAGTKAEPGGAEMQMDPDGAVAEAPLATGSGAASGRPGCQNPGLGPRQ